MRDKYFISISFFSLLLTGVVCAAAGNGPDSDSQVVLFKLEQVKLLDGPFKQAQEIDKQYILAHDPNRLLAPFRIEAGLEPKAEMYGDWESGGLGGHIGGHYLTALAQMYVDTGDMRMKQRLDYMVKELAECQQANGNGYVGGVPDGKALWEEVAAGQIKAGSFDLNGRWVPLYNLHKLWAGLRDAYLIAGNEQAKDVLIKLTDWWISVVSNLSDEQIQTMLRSEHGGLNEVFADVYAITGDEKYLDLAKRFNHRQLLDTLIDGRDILTGMHANTQIPKVIGFQRIAALSQDASLHQAAVFFWEIVTQKRSVAFGGNSVREHFNSVDDFQGMLEERQGPETCNTYNMLRLSEQLFCAEPQTRYVDFYERALFNHILSTEHNLIPGFVYFTPIRPRHYRVYSQPEMHFWCCVGSGMENHGKYGQFIYAHADGDLFVNLFMASALDWDEKNLELRQETQFPDKPRSSLVFSIAEPVTFKLQIRQPVWIENGGMAIKVNGDSVPVNVGPDGYVSIQRMWRDGDRIDIELPMNTYLERLPDGSDYAAVLHGPIVLAAKTSTDNLDGLRAGVGRWVHIPSGPLVPLNQAPMLVSDNLETLPDQIKPVAGKPMTFSASSVIEPEEFKSLELVPFFRLHDARYMMYWRLATPQQYGQVVEQLKAEERAKLVLEQNTLDKVTSGEQQPEMDHAYKGEQTETGEYEGRHWRDSSASFGYDLRITPGVPVELMVTYTTETRRRRFDILINDAAVAEVSRLPRSRGTFIIERYPIEQKILDSVQDRRLRVTFRARDNARTAQVCEVRLVKAQQ